MDHMPTQGTSADSQDGSDPFGALASMKQRICERGQQRTIDGAKIGELADIGQSLKRAADWAADMQLGHEGFDNTDMARRYRLAQEHLREAARALLAACVLLEEGAVAA